MTAERHGRHLTIVDNSSETLAPFAVDGAVPEESQFEALLAQRPRADVAWPSGQLSDP
jgi:hypothetical protein